MHADREVDARGLLCPLPVLRARKVMLGMMPGQVLCLRATDPAAVIDVPHFARENGHEIVAQYEGAGESRWWLRRAGHSPFVPESS
ncbi:sulfurtransferase TusA family protein [Gemmobacter nectariphilus]|uniref:sulfurtransferase TusA family protein n=1 Tax=Gemmobacter nectariphilus TaxID=220343 RepID=UPI0006869C80|nr:sulfurtransferase TusA family protein [Gemmobacter nectariphilus]